MKRNETDTVEITQFNLNLPDTFATEPDFTVDLPAKCKAYIYAIERADVEEYRDEDGKYRVDVLPGWRVVILNRAGQAPRAIGHCFRGSDVKFTDALDVQLHLRQVAVVLSKQKRTVVTEADAED